MGAMLRTSAWLLVVAIVLAVAGWYGSNWWLHALHPRFTATGLIEVAPPLTGDPIKSSPGVEDLATLAIEQNNNVQLLKNTTLFTEILKRVEVRDTSWFQTFQSAPAGQIPSAIADLSDHVVVTPLPGSRLISVSMSAADPAAAQIIVKALVDQDIVDQNAANDTERAERSMVLQEARDRYVAQKHAVSAYVRETGAELNVNADGSSQAIAQAADDISTLSKLQYDLLITLNTAQDQLDRLHGQIDKGVDPIEVTVEAERDPRVLLDFKTARELKLDQASAPAGDEQTDAAKNLAARIKAAQQMLDDDQARAKNEARDEKLSSLNDQISDVKRSMDAITTEVADHQKRLTDLSAVMTDYLVAKEEEAGYNALIADAKSQLDAIANISMVKNASGVSWSRQPVKPDNPDTFVMSMPPVALSMAIGLALGLGLGIAFASRPRR
jgi:hypothetical protein